MSMLDTPAADAAREHEDMTRSTLDRPGATADPRDPSPSLRNDAPNSDGRERLVPVGEAIRYRKRAQQAEQQFEDMQRDLQQTREQLAEASDLIARLERRQRIDQLLAESDAVDIEAARLLTEAAIADMDDPDVTEVVEDLRRHKPYLFGRSALAGTPTMGTHVAAEPNVVDQAQDQAATSGHRRDLLRYLRLRRVEHPS